MSMGDPIFRIEVRDYEKGEDPPVLTTSKIEESVQQILDSEGADGIVIVEAVTE